LFAVLLGNVLLGNVLLLKNPNDAQLRSYIIGQWVYKSHTSRMYFM